MPMQEHLSFGGSSVQRAPRERGNLAVHGVRTVQGAHTPELPLLSGVLEEPLEFAQGVPPATACTSKW